MYLALKKGVIQSKKFVALNDSMGLLEKMRREKGPMRLQVGLSP